MGWGWEDVFEGVSELFGAYSKYKEGEERKKEAKSAAKAAEENASRERERAKDALKRGVMEADRASNRKRALLAKQRATMGASGVTVGSGTFADVLSDTAASGKEDEDTILQNSIREAWGYKSAADQYSAQARSARSAAKKAGQAGLLGGLGSLAAGTYSYGQKRGWWES